jgi:hypothetical protein
VHLPIILYFASNEMIDEGGDGGLCVCVCVQGLRLLKVIVNRATLYRLIYYAGHGWVFGLGYIFITVVLGLSRSCCGMENLGRWEWLI